VTQSQRRVRVVSPTRRRVLEKLAERPTAWQTAAQLHAGETSSVGNTYAALKDLLELEWVQVRRDESRERRPGVAGRRPRGAYRVTDLGVTALIETALTEGDG
jgi:DNA-binding PadR family transcriptional regulator